MPPSSEISSVPEVPYNFEKQPIDNLAVVIPDIPSGMEFRKSVTAKGIDSDCFEAKITPRVVGNKLNEDPAVTADLAETLLKLYLAGYRNVAIGCYTLQLWKWRAIYLLRDSGIDLPDLNVISAFDEAEKAYPDPKTRPVWLGTTPTCKILEPDHFKTPVNMGLDKAQGLTQEIIWRTKAAFGADYSTSGYRIDDPDVVEDLTSKENLKAKVIQLIGKLKENNIQKVFMGCTELPQAFGILSEREVEEIYPGLKLIDPADAMSERYKEIIAEKNGKGKKEAESHFYE